MIPKVGDKYLITTDGGFLAPDGRQYMAVFGTVHGVYSDSEALGIKTNARSTNWYLSIGDMMVAGCQIHYAIKTDSVDLSAGPAIDVQYEGRLHPQREASPRIYCADGGA